MCIAANVCFVALCNCIYNLHYSIHLKQINIHLTTSLSLDTDMNQEMLGKTKNCYSSRKWCIVV